MTVVPFPCASWDAPLPEASRPLVLASPVAVRLSRLLTVEMSQIASNLRAVSIAVERNDTGRTGHKRGL